VAKVLCKLENASSLIDGVKFEKTPHGMLSEEISDAQVKHYLSISGFHPVPTTEQTQPAKTGAKGVATAQAEQPKVVAPASGGAANTAPPAGAPAQASVAAPNF
jgi:hypothetical protein